MSGEQRNGWLARWRERRAEKRRRSGPSPEKRAERHVPKADTIDVMLKAGGVDREGRFTKNG
jgi:hypothetical protein